MKKTLIAIVSVMTVAFFAACASGEKAYNSMGVETADLIADSVVVEEILKPSEWCVMGDEMLIISSETKKAVFRYRLPEWIFVDTSFSRGEGPEDVGSYVSLCQSNDSSVWISDLVKSSTRKLSISASELKVDTTLTKSKSKGGVSISMNGDVIFSDHYIMKQMRSNMSMSNITDISPEYLFCYDLKDSMRVVDSLFIYSMKKTQINTDAKGNIASISIVIYNNPVIATRGKKMLLYYPTIDVAQYLTVGEDGHLSQSKIIGEGPTFEQLSGIDWEGKIKEQTQNKNIVGATDDYVFVSITDIKKETEVVDGEEKEVEKPVKLSVVAYTWDMTPVKEFVLNHPEASTVIVDSQRGKIYARNAGEDFENVYIYNYEL
ncbi:MAG: hypothetical protein PHD21_08175 [Flavobacteriales bacterium]|nr:hypothetical protein [Flavobacteriales bacterium]